MRVTPGFSACILGLLSLLTLPPALAQRVAPVRVRTQAEAPSVRQISETSSTKVASASRLPQTPGELFSPGVPYNSGGSTPKALPKC